MTHPIAEQARNDLGGYILQMYGGLDGGTLRAANAVSALGALAGVFAQIQARAMMTAGQLLEGSPLVEIKTESGETFYFGDAINACVIEGTRERLAFWNLVAPAAQDPDVTAKIDLNDIAKNTAATVGGEHFGVPRIDTKYGLTEMPIQAVRKHIQMLAQRFEQIELPQDQLMWAFGAAAQGLARFACGEAENFKVDIPLPRLECVRLSMEAAIPMSKLDPATLIPKPLH